MVRPERIPELKPLLSILYRVRVATLPLEDMDTRQHGDEFLD